jgi:hypothetical protein
MDQLTNRFNNVFRDGSLHKYVDSKITDPWEKTIWRGYKLLGTYQKGQYGEDVIERYLIDMGFEVEKGPEWKCRGPYDRLVNNIKTEFKFSISHYNSNNNTIEKSTWAINHVAAHKDWKRLVFFGINENFEESQLVWFTKIDWLKHMELPDRLFGVQQSGKDGGNDDYMITGGSLKKFIDLPFVKKMNEW